ncbi:MAG: hypothetical protein ACRCVE_07165 [Plesiomonas sp.]
MNVAAADTKQRGVKNNRVRHWIGTVLFFVNDLISYEHDKSEVQDDYNVIDVIDHLQQSDVN